MAKQRTRYSIILTLTITIIMIYHLRKMFWGPRLQDTVIYTNEMDLGIRDPNVACTFPMYYPFHETILPFVSISNPLKCFWRTKVLTYIDEEGILKYNLTAIVESGYTIGGDGIRCAYNEINRVPKNDFEIDYGPEIPLTGNDIPKSDFVYVQCSNGGFQIYNNFHAFARRNPRVRKFKNDNALGIVVIGLDSLSRLNFMRQLPKTFRFVKDIMNGVVLYGFNKVGEKTWTNVVPMLTGKQAPEPPYKDISEWGFLWKEFSERGAATMYSEDLPEINMFNYMANGLSDQPTDHYMRTFWLAVEKSLTYKMSSPSCLGATLKHFIFFDYLKSFLRQYKESPVFLFSLFNELTHDFINTVGAIDDDLVHFLNSSMNEGLFNRSVVLLLGDHGNRMDLIRATEVGRIEDLMPLVSVILPTWVDKVYPSWRINLLKNQNRLTSTYDLYKTFQDILQTLETKESSSNNSIEKLNGTTLFKPVPVKRDCSDAGIPEWFCSCIVKEEHLDPESERSVKAANTIINIFNERFLKNLNSCSKLSLAQVKTAVMKYKNNNVSIEILFYTKPGNGLFEATLHQHNNTFSLIGNILRVNPYGDQAYCVPNELKIKVPELRGVCYCT